MASNPKVYILGAGSMGSLVAHEMTTKYPNALQMILLFKTQKRLNNFVNNNSELAIVKPRGQNIITSTSQLAAGRFPPTMKGEKPAPINNLIISTKTYQTKAALEPYIPNLNSNSNILILQNGMGMAQHLTETFWPNETNRPNILQAISTHGAYKTSPNVIHHVGQGKLTISQIPRKLDIQKPEMKENELPEFIKLLLQVEELNANYLPYKSFLLVQMEKLIVNACINPLTAVLDCLNGDLLYGTKIVPIMKRVINEAVQVFKAEYKILKNIPEANSFLNDDRLLNTVFEICKTTSQNSSSMREDMRNLNNTEIDWINGYIVGLGYQHKIPTPTNKMISSMVKNKLSIDRSLESTATNRLLNV